MNIGILTFHRTVNYGAVLQTIALQKILQMQGCYCDVINYKSPQVESRYFRFGDRGFSLKSVASFLLSLPIAVIHKYRVDKYIDQHLMLNCERSFTKEQLKSLNGKYDCFVVGSDQVWNYEITHLDTAYLLDFVDVPSKKCSYAASFGITKIPREYKETYRKYLVDFNLISVREGSGAAIISRLMERVVPTVLDPVLLLNKDQWITYSKPLNESDYILIYMMATSEPLLAFAKELSIQTGCKLLCINSGIIKKVDAKYIRYADPGEFLGLFLNAAFIVTNSFHGTAFSINFNKEFFVDVRSTGAISSRLQTILDTFDLAGRQIHNANLSDYDVIDWNNVNHILEKERKKSMGFIDEIIGITDDQN